MRDWIILAKSICEDQNLNKRLYLKQIVKELCGEWSANHEYQYSHYYKLDYQKGEKYKTYRRKYEATYRASHRAERSFDAMKCILKKKNPITWRYDLYKYATKRKMLKRVK